IILQRTTSVVLNGQASALLIHDGGGNYQGEGASLDHAVPDGLKGQPCKLRFVYAASGDFVFSATSPSSVIAQVYDATSGVLLNPWPGFLDGSGVFEGYFQIP